MARRLRLMSYNVRHARGMDGVVSIERIAEVVGRHEPDVVALQEVDVGRRRSGAVDQPAMLGRLIAMHSVFGETMHLDGGRYGNAVLSRWPVESLRSATLPTLQAVPSLEPRGAMAVVVRVQGRFPLRVVNTHLGLRRAERSVQMRALLEDDWMRATEGTPPVVMCGDFNCGPASAPHRLACGLLRDVRRVTRQWRGMATWPSFMPVFALDHVMVSAGIEVLDVHVPRDRFVRRASDHLPIVVTFRIPQT